MPSSFTRAWVHARRSTERPLPPHQQFWRARSASHSRTTWSRAVAHTLWSVIYNKMGRMSPPFSGINTARNLGSPLEPVGAVFDMIEDVSELLDNVVAQEWQPARAELVSAETGLRLERFWLRHDRRVSRSASTDGHSPLGSNATEDPLDSSAAHSLVHRRSSISRVCLAQRRKHSAKTARL